MGFDQFGVVSFTDATKAEQFVEYLKGQEIRGTVCKSCGAKFFPPKADCSVCLSGDMDWFPIDEEGTLISYTKAMFAPAGFEKDVPYLLGVAQFADGIKVFGRLDSSMSDDQVTVGTRMKINIVQLEGDRLTYELSPA
jgi:hypothetical protein